MTTYTNIAKPTNTSYSNINLAGKLIYDESSVLYDDADVFYDGLNQNIYTNLDKPSGTNYTNINKP